MAQARRTGGLRHALAGAEAVLAGVQREPQPGAGQGSGDRGATQLPAGGIGRLQGHAAGRGPARRRAGLHVIARAAVAADLPGIDAHLRAWTERGLGHRAVTAIVELVGLRGRAHGLEWLERGAGRGGWAGARPTPTRRNRRRRERLEGQ